MFRRSLCFLQRAMCKADRNNAGLIKSARMAPFISFKPLQIRHNSINNKKDIPSKSGSTAELKTESPQLMIAFTCKVCDTRSSHTFSKQSYTTGSVLIQCPGCKNRHLIADNLKVFRDEKVNLEDLLKAKGESVASSTEDLAFEDIPDSLRSKLGHYAKDAPKEYYTKETEAQYLEPGTKESGRS